MKNAAQTIVSAFHLLGSGIGRLLPRRRDVVLQKP
jgi:hypothetical protein